MKEYRFYAEMPEQQRSKSGSKQHLPFTRRTLRGLAEGGHYNNCIAVLLDEKGGPLYHPHDDCVDAFAPLFERANSDVMLSGPSQGYLRRRCVRIDEALARRLHPALFLRLDAP